VKRTRTRIDHGEWNLVDRFYVARRLAGLSHDVLSEFVGKYPTAISKLERGIIRPTPDRLREYSEGLLDAIEFQRRNLDRAEAIVDELIADLAQTIADEVIACRAEAGEEASE
jgi:transcriptional regulator with XRE-family HTH domain